MFDRLSLTELTSFGDGGRQPGQFYAVHSIATDSKGNVYTTETYRGQRLQKFVYKGLGPVTNRIRAPSGRPRRPPTNAQPAGHGERLRANGYGLMAHPSTVAISSP